MPDDGVTAEVLGPYGWSARWAALWAEAAIDQGRPGRVVRHDGSAVLTVTADGVEHLGLRPTTPPLAVGDWVVADPDDRVAARLPRTSLLQRRDADEEAEQLVAANVDTVVIVCGLDRPVRVGRIQRAVTQAGDAGAAPLLVLTKTDLDAGGDLLARARTAAEEADPTLEVLALSGRTGAGIDDLARRSAEGTIVLLGESGSGKSTLLNALAGVDLADTGTVREGDSKGRHTTTARTLHLLPGGGCLIDTPGTRALGLTADADAVDATFDDITELAGACRFRDCRHDTEPGCAIRAAVESGELAADRLTRFHRLRGEVESAARSAELAARRRTDR